MAHTYASVTEFKKFLSEGGTEYGTNSDADLLTLLEGVSRTVDDALDRSSFGSGFGPRIGTNVYDGTGSGCLDLRDDLISYTSGTVAAQTGGSTTAIADSTDFYLDNGAGRYVAPYRRLRLHYLTSVSVGSGMRIWSIVGKWGYQDEQVTATTAAEAMDTSETGYDVTDGTAFAIGQTLLADSEQMYITGISSNTLTVVRAANGTTAASHSSGITLTTYRYPREVVTATLLVAQRRWRMREAGVTGDFGGGGIPGQSFRDTERSIIRNTCRRLMSYAAA